MKTKIFLFVFLAFLFSLTACGSVVVSESGSEPALLPTKTPTAQPTKTPVALTEEMLRNMTYQGIYDELVTLTNGQYEGEPFVEGGASKPTATLIPFTAFGDLNGDGADDAVVLLVENSGGSGSFIYLAAVINQEGTPENAATTLLGDRVSPEAVVIVDGKIVLEAATHTEDDPMCCPSLKTRTTYALQNGELTTVSMESLTESGALGEEETAVSNELLGRWQWLAYQDTAGINDITLSDPARYTLQFLADGTAQIQADCNRASSSVAIEGSSLTLAPGPMTLAECEPGSLYNEYLTKLGDVVTYVIDEEDNLVLNLKMDAGNMVFGPEGLPAQHVPSPDIQSIRLDTQGLHASWQPVVMPEKPYDQSMPPGPIGLPAHIEILFDVTDPADRQFGAPIMYLIPVDAYRQMWNEAGNTAIANALDQIADRTYITNAPGAVTALPSEEIMGRIDLTAQIGRAVPFGQLNKTSATQSGYRFIGRWGQDANPVTNQKLTYVYQGFTNDGRYLVSFLHPVTTEALPAIDEVSQKEIDRLSSNYEAYMAEKTELLNGLDSADFTPNLATLDALVASLEIDGMPVSGLQDKTWLWISGPAQPGSSEIITVENPELYQVTYTSDGAVEIIADCNRASLSYELNQGGLVGGMLTRSGPMTLAECGPASLYQGFVFSLEAAQTYRLHPGGSELSLILPAGGGTLFFMTTP